MISVFVKKNEAGREAGLAGDLVGDKKYQHTWHINHRSSNNRVEPEAQKERPFSSVSDSALSGLNLKGSKMATQGRQRTRSRLRGASVSPQWLADRSYSVLEDRGINNDEPASWHLQPTFPDMKQEKPVVPKKQHKPTRILRRETSTETLLRRQSKMEREYKGMRDFTRSSPEKANSYKVAYKPPRGYTNFVTGKPLMEQDRPESGREKAHKRFLEKLEAQNRMLQDLSDSSEGEQDDTGQKKGVLKIPSCSDMDVCLHGTCNGNANGLSIQLAMDGLRIANSIEQSYSRGQESKKHAEIDHRKIVDGTTSSGNSLEKTPQPDEGPSDKHDYMEGANKLYEWSSVTANI